MARKQSLDGKRILLTGAAPADDPKKRTLGEKFAAALYAEGAELFLVDIKPSVHDYAKRLNIHGDIKSYVADVTKLEQMEAAAKEAVRQMGGIDIVIANAGMADITTFDNDPKRYGRICAVNEAGVYNTIRACMPYIKGKDKYVLVNASNGGIVPLFLMMAYNASKAHAIKLAQSTDLELIGTGARCGVLLLSEHASPMEDNFKKRLPRMLMKLNPLLKHGHKERDPKHAVAGMLAAVKGRRRRVSVPWYSGFAWYFPALVNWLARVMHRKVQPVADAAREEYENDRGIIFD